MKNNSIACYSKVYEKHADILARLQIFSAEVLKNFLQELNDGNFYFEEFFTANRMTRLDYEISKIFMATEKFLKLEDLQKIFPYVLTEKILVVISDTKKYLPAIGGYISVSKLKFERSQLPSTKVPGLSIP